MSRKERNQMFGYTNGTYTWTATTVRAGKSLMQIQMAYISPDGTRIGQTYLCIHICTIHVNLCSAFMNNFTNFCNFRFKDTTVTCACDDKGNVDVEDLRAKAEANKDDLAALMITYPSTHGIFEAGFVPWADAGINILFRCPCPILSR